MNRHDELRRVIIAMTESSPVAELWKAAMDAARDSQIELVAVYLHDERWEHAASLPFTREISFIGGSSTEFTLQRAEQLVTETASLLRNEIERLAREAGLSVAFEVLPESNRALIQALFGRDKILVVGPPVLAKRPVFGDLRDLAHKILLVETEKKADQDRS